MTSTSSASAWPEGDLLNKIDRINQGLNRKYPGNNRPFQIMTRLLEEAGELAKEVHHHEGAPNKLAKHGEPDRMKLANEAQHVLRAVLQIIRHYGAETEVRQSIEKSLEKLQKDGWLEA